MSNTASDAQIRFINSLQEQHDWSDPQATEAVELGRALWRAGAFDKSAASAVIDALKAAPRIATPKTAPAPEGMHLFGGVIFKVQRSPETGNVYAKALLDVPGGKWSFEYAPGAVKNLSEVTLMTLDQAKEFGALYGTCCVCSRTLTNEESIAAGIGPVCASKF